MVDTVTFTAPQSAAIDAAATSKGVTRAELLQAEANQNADSLRADQVNARWADLDLAGKEALLPA